MNATPKLPNMKNIFQFSPSAGSLKKYRGLMVLIAAFFLLTMGLLILNVWSTSQMLTHMRVVDIATRQEVLAQQIAKNVLDLDVYVRSMPPAEDGSELTELELKTLPVGIIKRMDDMQQEALAFDHVVKTFESGGKLLTPEGLELTVSAIAEGTDSRQALVDVHEPWDNYHRLISMLMIDYQSGKIRVAHVRELVDYAHKNNADLLAKSNKYAFAMHSDINRRASYWQTWQWGGIVLAAILFGLIVFGALRQLMNMDTQLEEAHSELNEIMSAIREGLFLLEKDFTIGEQHSTKLAEMLGQTDVKGRNFLDVIAHMLPESELVDTQMFIEQLYNPWVVEDLIEDLNPLHRIAVLPEQPDENVKYLDFKFYRVFKNEQVERILVSVIDSTESVILQSSLQAREEQEQLELEMLDTIVNMDSRLLVNFIHSSKERLDEINDMLQTPEAGYLELKAKANFMERIIHALKGDASEMRLTRMVEICNTIEDSLGVIRRQTSLGGQDFFGVIVLLEDLYRLLDILDDYSQRINNEHPQNQQAEQAKLVDRVQAEIQQLQSFVQDIATRNGKKASLQMHGFYECQMDDSQRESLHQVVVQLLRNSVVHGVEYPSVRRQRNKSEIGSLKLSLTEADGKIHLTAEDDGNGIDFDAIRSKAVAEGRYTVEEVGQLSKKQLLSVMLSDGFSTATQATEDAGRGVGMGVIRQAVYKMGGKLNINTAYQQYTRLNISFPPKQP